MEGLVKTDEMLLKSERRKAERYTETHKQQGGVTKLLSFHKKEK
jgi:hypothetical protein